MNISAPFINRPVATTLLTIGLALSGVIAFRLLPVAPLPQVDFPTISVTGSLPGASPENMATSVATPLERQLGRIAGVTEMTSTSTMGSTNIILQFDLNRNIDGAARDVQAAINAARSQLPSTLPSNPYYRKVNPADSPVLILALTSDVMSQGQMYDAASTILQQKLSQVDGVGQVQVGGSSLPAVRVDLNPTALNKYGIGLEDVRTMLSSSNANRAKGHLTDGDKTWEIYANDQLLKADEYRNLIVTYRNGAAVQLADVADVQDSVEDLRNAGLTNGKPAVLIIVYRQPAANIIETVDRVRSVVPQLQASIPAAMNLSVVLDRTTTIRASLRDVEITLMISIVPGDPGGVRVPARLESHADSERGGAGVADRNLRRDVRVRLQPRQPVADGADHRDRLRGRRRDRRARERLPPHGGRDASAEGRACRARARSASRCCP